MILGPIFHGFVRSSINESIVDYFQTTLLNISFSFRLENNNHCEKNFLDCITRSLKDMSR